MMLKKIQIKEYVLANAKENPQKRNIKPWSNCGKFHLGKDCLWKRLSITVKKSLYQITLQNKVKKNVGSN